MSGSGDEGAQSGEETETPKPGPDEMFCVECGAVIKKQAEICPECGVRQQPVEDAPQQSQQASSQQPNSVEGSSTSLTERRQYELEKIANNDTSTIVLIGFLISPVAYWMIGKKALAIINFLTLNYFFLGPIVVPIHCYSIINNAEEELRMAGVGGY